MRFLVRAVAYDSIIEPETVERLRGVFLRKIREISQSGKLVEGGHIVNLRGAFLLLDVDSAAELNRLLLPLHDICRIEAEVVESFEELGKALEETPFE